VAGTQPQTGDGPPTSGRPRSSAPGTATATQQHLNRRPPVPPRWAAPEPYSWPTAVLFRLWGTVVVTGFEHPGERQQCRAARPVARVRGLKVTLCPMIGSVAEPADGRRYNLLDLPPRRPTACSREIHHERKRPGRHDKPRAWQWIGGRRGRQTVIAPFRSTFFALGAFVRTQAPWLPTARRTRPAPANLCWKLYSYLRPERAHAPWRTALLGRALKTIRQEQDPRPRHRSRERRACSIGAAYRARAGRRSSRPAQFPRPGRPCFVRGRGNRATCSSPKYSWRARNRVPPADATKNQHPLRAGSPKKGKHDFGVRVHARGPQMIPVLVGAAMAPSANEGGAPANVWPSTGVDRRRRQSSPRARFSRRPRNLAPLRAQEGPVRADRRETNSTHTRRTPTIPPEPRTTRAYSWIAPMPYGLLFGGVSGRQTNVARPSTR